jgi:UDP-GlcNAc:undecaprenyl-phosphate GlcNAc-1-phosphate transferase
MPECLYANYDKAGSGMLAHFASTALVGIVVLEFSVRACGALGVVDAPGGRKQHKGQVPLAGGPALVSGLWLVFLFWGESSGLNIPVLVVVSGLFAVGLWDDLRGVSPWVRLLSVIVAASALIIIDNTVVHHIGDIFGLGIIGLGMMAVPFTLISYSGLVNAVNMIDGVDGLSSGVMIIAFAGLAFLWNISGGGAPDPAFIVFIALIIPFFARNFRWLPSGRPAAFMGDSGTMVLGFLLAWGCIRGAAEVGIPPVSLLLLAGMPLLDMWSVMAKRIRAGQSPFKPGRDHLHHCLLDMGLNVAATTLTLLACAFIFLLVSVAVALGALPEGVGFGTFLVGLVAAYHIVSAKLQSGEDRATGSKVWD